MGRDPRAAGRAGRAAAETRPIIRHARQPAPPAQEASGFDHFDLPHDLRRGIAAAGFTEPRPIQAEALPAGLEGRDVLGLAETGTGKTAAFVLPILARQLASRRTGPTALIVAPTRELVAQIHAELGLLAEFTPLTSTTVFGGVGQGPQVRALRGHPDTIVACPGRLLDLYGQGALRLDSIEVLVLDEADHMFDLGFLPSIRKIVAALPKQRQNLLFSATMPDEIRRLADRVLVKPHVVELNHSAPPATIEHALYPVSDKRKQDLLEHLLAGEGFTSAIVFLRTKHRAKRLAQRLDHAGHAAVALQGNMSQSQREKAMQGFRNGTYDVLVATDIAARGIDVAGVSHVINFDVPNTPDAYTHRIGRTGRSDQSGTACTFVTEEDGDLVRAIEKRLGVKLPRVRVEGFGGERRAKEAATPPTVFRRRAAPATQAASRARSRPAHKPPQHKAPQHRAPVHKAPPHAAARPARSDGKAPAKDKAGPGPAFGAGIPGTGKPQ